MALPGGLPLVGRAGPHDAHDSDDEQDGEGHVRADEGCGEGRSHDVEGRRGSVGQRNEEGDEGVGPGREGSGQSVLSLWQLVCRDLWELTCTHARVAVSFREVAR